MTIETVSQADTCVSTQEKYGGFCDGRIVRQHNRRIYVLKSKSDTYVINIKTLTRDGATAKIMFTHVHLSREAYMGIVQAIVDMDKYKASDPIRHQTI